MKTSSTLENDTIQAWKIKTFTLWKMITSCILENDTIQAFKNENIYTVKNERKKERKNIYLSSSRYKSFFFFRTSSMALMLAHCVVYTLVRLAEAFDRFRRGQVT
jgi:hypothetical protein